MNINQSEKEKQKKNKSKFYSRLLYRNEIPVSYIHYHLRKKLYVMSIISVFWI